MQLDQIRRSTAVLSIAIALSAPCAAAQVPRIEVSYNTAAYAGPLTGRLILMISKTAQPEPRLALSPRGPAIVGVDIEQLPAGRAFVVDDKAVGFPSNLHSGRRQRLHAGVSL
jgi:hypothetical protein